MLDEFIKGNREEIVTRTRGKVAARSASRLSDTELRNGVPLFLDQLVDILGDKDRSSGELGAAAVHHGSDMLRYGFSVKQVVQGYGDVCQAVTELAIERKSAITTEEFRTLNACLDEATAAAVTEYELQRDRSIAEQGTERLGVLAHELRNVLNSAVISFDILKRGGVGVGGSTGAVLGRSLSTLRDLIDRAVAEMRLESGISKRKRVRVWEFIEELEVVATFEANNKELKLTVACVDDGAEVEIDRHILAAAVGNLLQNAFRRTPEGGSVTLRTRATASRVVIEVEAECGAIPSGDIEALFDQPGLTISRRGVEANGGELHLRDLPGEGCVFTVDLPRSLQP